MPIVGEGTPTAMQLLGLTHRRGRSKYLTIASALLTFGVLIAAAMGTLARHDVGTALLLEILLSACIALPLLVRVVRRRFDLFEPIVGIAMTYTIYFVVGPLVRLFSNDTFFVGRDFRPLYPAALIAVIVAVLAMWIGYHSPFGGLLGRRIPAGRRRIARTVRSGRYLRYYGWGLTLAAAGALLLWQRLTGRSLAMFFLPALLSAPQTPYGDGRIAYLFLAVEWFAPAFLILSISNGFRPKFVGWLYFALVTIAYISLGSRYRIVTFWAATLVLVYLRKGKRPGALITVLGLSFVLLFSGWLSASRYFFRSGGSRGAIATSVQVMQARSLNDTKVFEAFAAVLDAVPARIDFAYAQPIEYVFIQPIPRSLWPAKPYPEFLDKIAEAVGTRGAEAAGLAVPQFGEYYLAFGWVGLVGGMFLFGIMCNALWHWFRVAPDDPWRQVVFALSNVFIFNIIIRGYTAQMVQAWFFIVFPAVLGMYLSRGRRRRQGLVHA